MTPARIKHALHCKQDGHDVEASPLKQTVNLALTMARNASNQSLSAQRERRRWHDVDASARLRHATRHVERLSATAS